MDLRKPQTRNWLQIIFLTPAETRLRAGWRLVLHSLLFLILTTLAGIVFFIPVGIFHISFDSPLATALNEFSLLVGITFSTFIARLFLDKRSMASLGLRLDRFTVLDLLAGFFISAFPMGLVFGIEISLGWSKFDGFAWESTPTASVLAGLAAWMVIFIAGGLAEELLSRGYHLQTVESGLNLFWGVFLSSIVFALLHLSNPGANWISTLGIFMAGLYLALPYILTRQLWLSIGAHIGWNFFEGVVFGLPVSGINTFSLLHHTIGGPELWTGGVFGPEAGLLGIAAMLLGSILLSLYASSNLRTTEHG